MEPLFTRVVQQSHEWLGAVADALGTSDHDRAWRALRAALHALRDRLPPDEAVQLGAQLPMVMRGLYYEGWRPHRTPLPVRDRDDFLAPIQAAFRDEPAAAAEHVARSVYRVLADRVSPGEIHDVRGALPEAVRELWPAAERMEVTKRAPRRAMFRGRIVAAVTRTPDAWEPRAGRVWQRLVRTAGVMAHRHGLEPARLEADLTRTDIGLYAVRLVLDGATDSFRADHVDETLPAALGRAFDKLFREVELRRAPPATTFAAEVIPRAPPPRPPKPGPSLHGHDPALARSLPALERAAQHEVALLQAEGLVEPGNLDPAELVDEIVVEVLPELPDGLDVEEVTWVLLDRLAERVDALRHGDPPETDGGELSALALDIRDIRSVDEDWRLEDALVDEPDHGSDALAADRELRHLLMNALFHLPDEDRRVFSAVVIDGLSLESVSGRRPGEAADRLERAETLLGRTLDPRAPLPTARVRELYGGLRR